MLIFQTKKTHKAVILIEEWALQILVPDVPRVLKEALNNSETNERYKKSNTSPGGEFKITNKNFTKKAQANYNNQNEDCNTTTEQIKKKYNTELAKTINSALEDLLKNLKKNADNEQMSNKALGNMKSIFDAGSAMTVLMNKGFGRMYENFMK